MKGIPAHKTKVLAVDDDSTMRLMIEGTLEAAGYAVTTLEDPRDAIPLVESGDYPVVISDWNMPQMTGVELCRAVRDLGIDRYVYFILLTSKSESADVVEGLDSGADDFVAKPFNPAELEKRVEVGIRTASLDTRDATIFALAKLAESRDPETGAHLERVRNYAKVLAERLLEKGLHRGLVDRGFVRLMYATTPLHDIGKVAIPDNVLLKPGQLNDREFDVMKSHTVIGAETLAAVADRYPWAPFLRTACDIARHHHERWDGTGYPDGLAGEAIPLPARIMSIADVYDALTSKRVYKEAFEHDVAVAIIRDNAGTQFDPELAEVFLEIEQAFHSIRKQYEERGPERAAA